MGKERKNGQMAQVIRVNTKMDLSMEMEHLHGLMVAVTLGNS